MSFSVPDHTPYVTWQDSPSEATALDSSNLNANTLDLIAYIQAVVRAYDLYVQAMYAPLDSPAFTGNPTVPTPASATDNDQSVPSTAWTNQLVALVLASGATPGGPPVNVSPPVISNLVPHTGDVVTVTVGVWTGSPVTYAYQWQRSPNADGSSAVNITSGTGYNTASYTVQSADAGNYLVCSITATNSVPATSSPVVTTPTQIVTSASVAAPANTAIPAVSGTAQQGQTLTGTQGTWTGTGITYTYQWARLASSAPAGQAGVHINGATSLTYGVTAADVGNTLYFIVYATNSGGTTPAYSTQTTVVTAAGGGGGGGGGGSLLWAPTFTIGVAPAKGSASEFASTGSAWVGSDISCVADPLGSGTPVYKYAVANADQPSTGHPRADLLSGTGIVEGSSVFVSIPFYLPVGVAGVNSGIPVFGGGGTNFCQWAEVKDTIGGPPTWGLYIQGVSGVQSYVLRSGSTGAVYWHTPVNNAWHTATLSGVWSRSTGSGYFNLWWDGAVQTFSSTGSTTLNIATLGSSTPQVGSGNQPLDINSYRAANYYSGVLVTYHGRPKIGTTLASVLPDSGVWTGP